MPTKNFPGAPTDPTFSAATIAPSNSGNCQFLNSASEAIFPRKIVIQNLSTSDVAIQFETTTYDGDKAADHVIEAGDILTLHLTASKFALYNDGAATLRFAPSSTNAHDENFIVRGWIQQ